MKWNSPLFVLLPPIFVCVFLRSILRETLCMYVFLPYGQHPGGFLPYRRPSSRSALERRLSFLISPSLSLSLYFYSSPAPTTIIFRALNNPQISYKDSLRLSRFARICVSVRLSKCVACMLVGRKRTHTHTRNKKIFFSIFRNNSMMYKQWGTDASGAKTPLFSLFTPVKCVCVCLSIQINKRQISLLFALYSALIAERGRVSEKGHPLHTRHTCALPQHR